MAQISFQPLFLIVDSRLSIAWPARRGAEHIRFLKVTNYPQKAAKVAKLTQLRPVLSLSKGHLLTPSPSAKTALVFANVGTMSGAHVIAKIGEHWFPAMAAFLPIGSARPLVVEIGRLQPRA